eukprot:4337976-Amphidinium_carterae.1
MAEAVAKVGRGFCLENSAPRPSEPSIIHLPEFPKLQQTYGVQMRKTHQCMFGADTTKPTMLAWYGGGSKC